MPYLRDFMALKAMFDIYTDFKGTVFVREFYKSFKSVTILRIKKRRTRKKLGEKEMLDDTELNKKFAFLSVTR